MEFQTNKLRLRTRVAFLPRFGHGLLSREYPFQWNEDVFETREERVCI